MAFTYVTLQAGEGYLLATGATPSVTRIRASPLVAMTNGPTTVTNEVVLPLDADGVARKSIAATTDPDTLPVGNAYRLKIEVAGRVVHELIAEIPHDEGAVVDISDLVELESPPTGLLSNIYQLKDADLTALAGLTDGFPVRESSTWVARSTTGLVRNLRDYGAVGDGVTDDSAAINAWATAGGLLYAPPGTYLHDGATRPRITVSGTLMWGVPGASIFTSSILYDGSTSSTDVDLFIVGQGSGAETSNVTVDGIVFAFTSASSNRGGGACLRTSRVHNLRITNCKFRYGSYGLHINRAHGFWIAHNEVRETKADGIQCNNGSDSGSMTLQDGWIIGNKCYSTGDDAIAVGGKQDGEVLRSQPTNVHVLDNDIDTTLLGGGVGIYGLAGGTVARNRIRDSASHFITVRLDTQYDQYPSSDISVSDNECVSTLTPSGSGNVDGPVCMWLGGRNASPSGNEMDVPLVDNIRIERNRFLVTDRSGIWCQPHATLGGDADKWLRRVVIRNNDLIFTGSSAIDYRGLYLQCVNDVEVSGNRIEGFPSHAATVNQFIGLRWSNNAVAECLSDATYAGSDMVLIGNANTATDTLVEHSGNSYRKTSGTANRLLNIKATGSTTYPYVGNRFYSTGATITTAVETTDGKGVASFASLDSTGHVPASVMPIGPRAATLLRRTNAVTETFPRMGVTLASLGALVSGQQQFVAIALTAGTVVTSIVFYSGGTAAVTPTNQWFGLWTSARGQLALTSDDTTTAWASNSEKTLNLASPYTVTADGLYYLSCMVAAATVPSLIGVSSSSSHLAAAPALTGRDQTNTGLTNPASAPSTAAAFSATGAYPYAYVK